MYGAGLGTLGTRLFLHDLDGFEARVLEDSEGAIRPLLDGDITVDQQNTQQLRPVFFPSGAAWAVRMAALRAQRSVYCKPIEMVQMEPECCVDIDDDLDLHYAETIAAQYGFRPLAAPEVAS